MPIFPIQQTGIEGVSPMKMLVSAIVIVLFTSLSAFAFQWNVKPADERLSGSQVKKIVGGKTISFTDGSKEIYKGRRYVYVDKNGKEYPPIKYKIARDGVRCMFFGGGSQRCDLYVKHKGKLVLIDSKGRRWKTSIR